MKNEIKNPLVSVIIPAYNHEKYIKYTIESIVNQTYQNIELIIIDDGSSDSTYKKIEELRSTCLRRFKNLIIKTRENMGVAETLNELISFANGKYVYLSASDDILQACAIEKEVAFLEKHNNYVLVVGDNQIIDSENQVCYWDENRNIIYDKNKSKYQTFAQFLQKATKIKFKSNNFGKYEKLYFANHIPNGYLIRKSTLDKIPQFCKEAPLEDWFLMLQLSKWGKMKFIDEILFSYRWHNSNAIKNVDKMQEYQRRTENFEEKILKNSKIKKYKNYAKYGILTKKQGIPFVFELLTHKKENKKTKFLKIFNLNILKFTK